MDRRSRITMAFPLARRPSKMLKLGAYTKRSCGGPPPDPFLMMFEGMIARLPALSDEYAMGIASQTESASLSSGKEYSSPSIAHLQIPVGCVPDTIRGRSSLQGGQALKASPSRLRTGRHVQTDQTCVQPFLSVHDGTKSAISGRPVCRSRRERYVCLAIFSRCLPPVSSGSVDVTMYRSSAGARRFLVDDDTYCR
ncbi:hypothetical protein TNCV_36261 [Trichonephila clavipes]|nr:hypothetical protein TNCV_36261 [Trichonephila clavipes]